MKPTPTEITECTDEEWFGWFKPKAALISAIGE